MNLEFLEALDDLEREKHMSKDMLIDAIESALVSAYKKNYGTSQNVRVDIDRQTGDINVFMRRDIVEEVEDPFSQASLEEAQEKLRGSAPGEAQADTSGRAGTDGDKGGGE